MEIKIDNDSIVSDSISLGHCNNVKITVDQDNKKIIFSAPTLNHTRLKNGAFEVSGEYVELVAGDNIIIKTAHPNKVIIGSNIDKYIVALLELQKRFDNLEKVVLEHIKKR